MSSIAFDSIAIIDPNMKLAKSVRFSGGFNVITASQQSGNDRGKSVVMRSLFHTLGAEGLFDSKFDSARKAFLLEFTCDARHWTMLRNGSSYSLFDSGERLAWGCHGNQNLAELLFETFGFKVMLPGRAGNELEIAPPAYSYLPNHIDQRGNRGSEFSSFANLGQYKNPKADLFYTYAGVTDERYYSLTKERDDLTAGIGNLEGELRLRALMIDRVDAQLGDAVFFGSMEVLDAELAAFEAEYERLSNDLAGLRAKLMDLRRDRSDRARSIEGAVAFGRHWDRGYRRLRQFKECPLCRSVLKDELDVRVEECETREDVLFVKAEMERDLNAIDGKIARTEERYRHTLGELAPLRDRLRKDESARRSAAATEGLVEMRDELVAERAKLASEMAEKRGALDRAASRLKKYGDKRRAADHRLAALLKEGAMRLNLQGIDLSKVKSIRSTFKSNGSNQNLATLVWYLSIQQVQREMNPGRIRFPMVIDSPMSGEQDDEKKEFGYDYIISSLKEMHQVILSGLAVEDFAHLPEGTNIITLENEKYHLLNEEDYEGCRRQLGRLLDAGA